VRLVWLGQEVVFDGRHVASAEILDAALGLEDASLEELDDVWQLESAAADVHIYSHGTETTIEVFAPKGAPKLLSKLAKAVLPLAQPSMIRRRASLVLEDDEDQGFSFMFAMTPKAPFHGALFGEDSERVNPRGVTFVRSGETDPPRLYRFDAVHRHAELGMTHGLRVELSESLVFETQAQTALLKPLSVRALQTFMNECSSLGEGAVNWYTRNRDES